MNHSHSDSLIVLNQQGFIPGPEETEEAFQSRTTYCLHLKNTLEEELKEILPFKKPKEYPECFQEALAITQRLYKISPSWIPLFFSNYRLLPWYGGCAWIFKKEIPFSSDTPPPTGAFLQLRKSFYKAKKRLWIYERSELIAHELVHVGRMEFNEPKFEEHLAYRTSSSKWRQWWGPIAQSPWETTLFAGLLLLIFLLDMGTILWGKETFYWKLMWLKIVPLFLFVAGVIRLIIRHKQINRCLKTLQSVFHLDVAQAVLYRLTDKEIITISKMDPQNIESFLNKNNTLRWRVIREAYFPKNLFKI